MTRPEDMLDATLTLLTGCLLSVVLFFSIGQAGDRVFLALENTILFELPNIAWDTSATYYTVQSMFFAMQLLPAILGIMVFILTAAKKQKFEYEETEEVPMAQYQLPGGDRF